ncbi:helix-turn-helix domain-containing protein [Streptomyces sp. GMY02]|uniref:helix-turn-helix domain-containing protein n=1 Tax=Streptomyces sp. GMY02 TaxID=1333528 RepID=UPI001C2B92FF|nr:helix-turn-helix domain-containing protein [Streptomyces sp. GMY02]QXE35316.1 helix-turn-helix domain-containing protein [Streptomyces sp. GMY02]
MAGPRRDTRGIVDAPGLFARVRFRRRAPAPSLRPYLEHYWLIDWDLDQPYVSQVVPHPSVNVVFQRFGYGPGGSSFAEVAGIGLELFSQRLEGRGRVCGVQFRPGGFRPFAPRWPVSEWTGRRVPLGEVMPATDADIETVLGDDEAGGTGEAAGACGAGEDARVAALDTYLLGIGPRPDPQADQAMALADRIRTDRTIRRVAQLATAEGVSTRSLQRLFAAYVGVGPKWVILRYRIHEALERAESDAGGGTGSGTGSGTGTGTDPSSGTGTRTGTGSASAVDWAELASELGYSDQAHLVRDFTATVGVPPTAYARQGP